MTTRRPIAPTRRQLLLGGLAAFGSAPVAMTLATAAALADRYFVFCYFPGGWDVLLSLDPRDPDVFRSDLIQDTLIQPAYGQILAAGFGDLEILDTAVPGMQLGPFGDPLVPFADRMSVIRGMSMETLTHEVGRRRFITGKPPSGLQARGSSIATHLAAQLGVDAPIPNLSARVETYNTDQPSWASALKVDDVDDLVRALAPGDVEQAVEERERLDALLEQLRECPATQASQLRTDAIDLRLSAHDLVDQGLDALFDFDADTPEMEALRDHYGFGGDSSSPEAQAAMASVALTAGLSRCVSISVTESLDTHYSDWLTLQGPRQHRGLTAVAALASDLASRPYGNTGESWLDRTVILGFSEFSRTALLNSSFGRDHSLTNACFLLGGGLRGGQVIGRSSDVGMGPVATNLVTGVPDEGGEVVRPEHVLRALLVHAGVTDDVADLRVDPLEALL